MTNAIDLMTELASSQPTSSGPRLSHTEKCQAFACLKMGVMQKTVAKVFGLSSATVAYMGAAERPRRAGERTRYREIVAEFNRMGDRAFLEHYVSDEIHARVARVKKELEQPGDVRILKGPNPKAIQYSFDVRGVIETRTGELFRIDWIKGGWLWIPVLDNSGRRLDGDRYRGAECNDPFDSDNPEPERKPYTTSSQAYYGLLRFVGDIKPK